MNGIQKLEHWADTHHPRWIDLLRIALGIFIFAKGLFFAQNVRELINLIDPTLAYAAGGIAHYVIAAHLMGGLLIVIGLITRWAIAFQIPILLGALVFANISVEYNYGELWQTILGLAFLIVFFIYGSGKLSVDYYLKNHPN